MTLIHKRRYRVYRPYRRKLSSNGLIDVMIKAVTGFLKRLIQAVAVPFLAALDFLQNQRHSWQRMPSVFNLWLALVRNDRCLIRDHIWHSSDFHVMSAASFGFDEIEFKHLLARIGLVFLLRKYFSIFAIDGIIELSNVANNRYRQSEWC